MGSREPYQQSHRLDDSFNEKFRKLLATWPVGITDLEWPVSAKRVTKYLVALTIRLGGVVAILSTTYWLSISSVAVGFTTDTGLSAAELTSGQAGYAAGLLTGALIQLFLIYGIYLAYSWWSINMRMFPLFALTPLIIFVSTAVLSVGIRHLSLPAEPQKQVFVLVVSVLFIGIFSLPTALRHIYGTLKQTGHLSPPSI